MPFPWQGACVYGITEPWSGTSPSSPGLASPGGTLGVVLGVLPTTCLDISKHFTFYLLIGVLFNLRMELRLVPFGKLFT